MSFAELILIAIISLVVLKPADLKSVAKFIRDTISYLNKLKEEIWGMIDDEKSLPQKDQEQINHYLAKIIQMSGKYEGDYDLPSVKACYHKLLLRKKKSH
jgi:hypothetical protein